MKNNVNVLAKIKALFKNRFRVVMFIILIGLIGFLAWRVFGKKQQKPQYQTAKVERGTIISSVSVSGQIISSNIINVTTQASGVIKRVFVKDGDAVSAGQQIMEITLDRTGQQKNASAWSSYLSAKNSLESAKATQYSLQSDLFTKWRTYMDLAQSSSYQNSDSSPKTEQRTLPQFMSPQDDWLAAEAKYKNQEAVISQAQSALNNAWLSYQLSSLIVTAPIAGTISSFSVVEGMSVDTTSQSQKIAVIQNQTNPLATFNLSEIDVSKVKIGQKATTTLDSQSEKTFTGKVVSVDKIGSITSGVTSYPMIIQFDTAASGVLPNMAANASIIIDAKDNVLFIPSGAIQNVGGQSTVRVLKNNKEQTVQVETGLTSDTQTEIISGLAENDEIIVSTLSNGQNQQSGSSPFGGAGFMRSVGGGQRRPD